MDIQVTKVGERRGDVSRYLIEGPIDSAVVWSFRALNVLVRLGGMTTNAAMAKLDNADLEYERMCGICPW